ncbi:MAG: HAMP domain-containing histidine kinase, partial [Acidobacteria bacterium]|nr:HAMP domain-containing histidine kinase [Acidobacteriota bacterium]
IKTRKTNDDITIEITDNGIGMSEKTIERIFDPGFTTKGSGVGTGLGLSIVHQIIAGHNGKIEVNSKKGKGTTFRLTLPIHG